MVFLLIFCHLLHGICLSHFSHLSLTQKFGCLEVFVAFFVWSHYAWFSLCSGCLLQWTCFSQSQWITHWVRSCDAGAQIIDLMLLVVDITKGVQTQTAECLVIGEITCDRMIVVLNKIDLVEPAKRASTIERVRFLVVTTAILKRRYFIVNFCSNLPHFNERSASALHRTRPMASLHPLSAHAPRVQRVLYTVAI